MFYVRLAVHLAVAVFDDVLFCLVLSPHEIMVLDELSQFLRLFLPTFTFKFSLDRLMS